MSVDEWIYKVCDRDIDLILYIYAHTHKGTVFSHENILPFLKTLIIEVTVLSVVSQTDKDKYSVV